jgi:hypothetical protein
MLNPQNQNEALLSLLTQLLETEEGKRAFYDLIWAAIDPDPSSGCRIDRSQTVAIAEKLIEQMADEYSHPYGFEYL